jgi:aldehyde:ferredoxin oxidoreductase
VAALRLLLAEPADEAPVSFVTSALSGVDGVGLARCAIVGISPLSGSVAETRAEGPFAAGMRAAAVTGIVVTGRSAHPVYLLVTDGTAELVDASALWGRDTVEATAALTARHGPGAAIAVIGPAGEAGVWLANVIAAGIPLPRLGFGALLGDKRLKAVVCVGEAKPAVADPATLARLTRDYTEEIATSPLARWQHEPPGFGAWPGTIATPGYTSVRNFSDTTDVPGPGLAPQRFAAHLTSSSGGCPGCPNDCVKGFNGVPLHQEAVAMLGANLGIDDLGAVLAANVRCHELGLDPVSVGGMLGCLFEAHALGVESGLPGRFGDAAALIPLIERCARGDRLLARGAWALAQALGVPALAMTVRGVELPPFDPRVQPGLGLGYAVAPIGPRYDIVEHDLDFDPERGLPECFDEARRLGLSVSTPAGALDVQRTARLLELWSGLDALLICPYASTPTRPLSLQRINTLVEAVTGETVDVFALGRERLRLQFAVNDRLGLGPATLPQRFFAEPVAAGPFAGMVLDRAAFAKASADLRSRYVR